MLMFYLAMLDTPEQKSKFQMIYENYTGQILQTAHSLVRNHMDAEDIAQDVFIKSLITSTPSKLKTPYVFESTIIQSDQVRINRFAPKEKHKENPNDLIDDWEQFPAVTTDIEECVFSHELINMAVNFVSQMDEKYRAPLTLAVLGYRIKEIASLLGMSEANTKVRISRARHMLRAYILQEENQVEQEHDIS